LTPSARSGNLIPGDGNGLPRSEQRTAQQTKNYYSTGKAPYKFESAFLHQRVYCEPDLSGRIPLHIAEDAIAMVMEDGTSHPTDIITHARRPAPPSFTEFYPA
jgi:hypothetical protein